MKFGDKLKTLRKENGLTQAELAEKLGVNRKTIINYENGSTYPHDRKTYDELSKIFNIEAAFLYSETGLDGQDISDELTDDLIDHLSAAFAGGNLSQQAKDKIMKAITEIYWETKNNS